VDEEALGVAFEVDPVLLGAVAVQRSPVARHPAEALLRQRIQILRQEMEFREEVELEILRELRHLRRADPVEDYLKHAPTIGANRWRLARRENPGKIRFGYEIPFNRLFYVFPPPRPLAEIDAELKGVNNRILTMNGERRNEHDPAAIIFDRKLESWEAGNVKATLDLPGDLLREMKLRAVLEGRKFKDVAAEVFRRGLTQPATNSRIRHRVKLPMVKCRHPAVKDLTPADVADVLIKQEAEWIHEASRR